MRQLVITGFIVVTALIATIVSLVMEPGSRERLDRFTLDFAHGGTFSNETFEDKWTILYVGYAHCPDACPIALRLVGQALKQLEEQNEVLPQAIFVSVDPNRDTQEFLRDYVTFFHPNLYAATGRSSELDTLTRSLKTFYKLEPADEHGNYKVIHPNRLFLISPKGEVVGSLLDPHEPKEVIDFIHNSVS